MVAVGDVNGTPTTGLLVLFVVLVVVESVQVVKVPGEGPVGSVDFEGIEGFVPASVTGGLEDGQ